MQLINYCAPHPPNSVSMCCTVASLGAECAQEDLLFIYLAWGRYTLNVPQLV